MTSAATFIPKVFEQQFEAVGLLWSRRRAAVRSPQYAPSDVADLDETIQASFDGLAAGGDDSLPVLEAELAGDEPLRVFAAAFSLLLIGTPGALSHVMDALTGAEGAKLESLRDALAHGPSTPLHPLLRSLSTTARPEIAATATEVLAIRGAVSLTPERLESFAHAEHPAARAAIWRAAAYCGVTLPDHWYEAALLDEDPKVKRAAFEAATWNRSPVFYSYARGLASAPTPESVEPIAILAAVAPPEEFQLIGAVAANPAAGPDRFRVVASFGHPYFVDTLIAAMENPDPSVAASAGMAFEKLTGWNGQSVVRGDASSDTDAGAPNTAFVPDARSARKHWVTVASRLAHTPRIARGFDVSHTITRDVFDLLDTESRWEYCLRMRLFSGWQGTPLVLERYPQRF